MRTSTASVEPKLSVRWANTPIGSLASSRNGDSSVVKTLGYWLIVALLALLTFAAFRYTVMTGWTVSGVLGLVATLVLFALLLSFGYSQRLRNRSGPPIAR